MPLFASQTLGAFNDNLFKSAFVMLVTYGATMRSGIDPGLLAAVDGGTVIASVLLVLCAIGAFAASLVVPHAPAPAPALRLSRNPIAAIAAILRQARQNREVRLAILGVSWFWLVGAVFLSQIPV